MEKTEFNPLNAPLSGSNLIEANAGTGKTYNITAIFTRMVTELQYPVESILVVTYTNAAVSDLKAKIYQRLSDVLCAMTALLSGKTFDSPDPFPKDYAELRKDVLTNDIKLLKSALRDFDQSSVFTIHSFCQRMLKESAFSGKVAFDIELTGDSREIIRRPIYNFWRQTAYKAHSSVMPMLIKFTPDKMIEFYRQVQSNQSVEILKPETYTEENDIIRCVDELTSCFEAVISSYEAHASEVKELLNNKRKGFPLYARTYSSRNVPESFKELEKLIKDNNIHCPLKDTNKKIHRLTNESIEDKAKGEPVKHMFFDLVSEWYEKEEEYQNLQNSFMTTIRYNLCTYMEDVLEEHKRERDLQSYDDLISRMRASVIENDGHSPMTSSIKRKYLAALIDEFQDTDPYQYDIFETVFGRHGRPFFMIGDPKQAIYSFRGADVFAYLKAATSSSRQYTLTKNFRSDPDLVEGINNFFHGNKPFILDQIEYKPSAGTDISLKANVDSKDLPPVTIWETENVKAEDVAISTARHIAELLNKSESGNASINGAKIKPSDIAVLCRSNPQMRLVKKALAECRVPAVVSGSESVFASEEAIEITNVLKAVISPFNQSYIKTALATSAFGYTAKSIYDITDSTDWDDISEEFRSYNDLLNLKGFAPMFFKLINGRRVYNRLASARNGERKLTNYIHIAELAQKFEASKNAAPQDVLRYLTDKINSSELRDDEAELKMDSDENAVTIITIHKSKGLEYNIVYSPFLMFNSKSNAQKNYPKYHVDDRFILDLTDSEESKAMSDNEENAENIRIAYVALTRAKSACFTAWGNCKDSDKSALSYLINGLHSKFESSTLHSFKTDKINITLLPEQTVQTYSYALTAPNKPNEIYSAEALQGWQINSFSRLVHSSSSVKDTDQFSLKVAEMPVHQFDIFNFPKGAKAGTCLHECMEEIYFESFNPIEINEIVYNKLSLFSFDTDYTSAVAGNIQTILNKKMHNTKLANLKAGDYISEMEFQMSTESFSADKISNLFHESNLTDYANAASTLSFTALQGYINGFADLIFFQNEKYYILDWKSNHLGMSIEDYSYDKMHEEMLGSHYYLQMYIYTLALHKYLNKTLPNYSYEKHMGGGIYVFMRGVNNSGDEGIYFHKPDKNVIEGMEKLVKND